MEHKEHKNILYTLLAASFLIHMGISWVAIDKGNLTLGEQTEDISAIKMKLLPTRELKQIVESEKSQFKEKNNSRFLSQKNNTFARQTRAANNGRFKAAGKGVREATVQKNNQQVKKQKQPQKEQIKISDLAFKKSRPVKIKKRYPLAKLRQQRKGLKTGQSASVGLGRTNDYLEDIPLGDFTKLNTQEYEFYGFYHRIRQKLEQFWGLNIQEKANKLFKQGRTIASDSNLITGLTIKIDSQGRIVDIILKSTSGVKELDDAAIKSFNQAGPFPNPPSGMIQADGKATIDWGFVVNT